MCTPAYLSAPLGVNYTKAGFILTAQAFFQRSLTNVHFCFWGHDERLTDSTKMLPTEQHRCTSWKKFNFKSVSRWWHTIPLVWKRQGNFKGELVVAAILPSRMEVSYCTYGFFRSQARQANVSCLSHVDLNHTRRNGYRAVNHTVTIMCVDCAECLRQIRRYNDSTPYVTVNMATTP